MWLLVRANAYVENQDGSTTLAACPDSDDRGEPWRWTVTRHLGTDGRPAVTVQTSPTQVRAELRVHENHQNFTLERAAGEELVIAVLEGSHLLAHGHSPGGDPWIRQLGPGDVYIDEGEDAELLRVTVAPGPSRVAVVRLASTRGQPLRWVP